MPSADGTDDCVEMTFYEILCTISVFQKVRPYNSDKQQLNAKFKTTGCPKSKLISKAPPLAFSSIKFNENLIQIPQYSS